MVLLRYRQRSHRRESMQKCLRRVDSMKPEDAMTPRLDSESKPKIDMIAKNQVSHTSLTFGNVAPVVAGSLNVPTAELFRDISGCHRP